MKFTTIIVSVFIKINNQNSDCPIPNDTVSSLPWCMKSCYRSSMCSHTAEAVLTAMPDSQLDAGTSVMSGKSQHWFAVTIVTQIHLKS